MRRRRVLGLATQPDAIVRLQQKFEYPDLGSGAQAAEILPALSGGVGAFVHLARNTTQSIAAAGEAISWNTISALGYARFNPSVPTTTVTIPEAGYYNVGLLIGWLTFTGGGNVKVQRNGIDVWPPADDPGLWTATDGQLFEGTAHGIECLIGDTISVILDPDDASAQNLESATLSVYLVDRTEEVSDYRDLVMSHDPVGYWRLGESSGTAAADETGTHGATYQNTPTLGVAGIMQDGSGDTAADFIEASSEHVLGQDWATMDFAAGAFSLECWFNADDLDGVTQVLIIKRNDVGTQGNENGWELSALAAGVFFSEDSNTAIVSSGAVANDTDYHVVVTFDGTVTMRLYLNGVQVDSDTGGISITANTVNVTIGYDDNQSDFAFDGTIDEVAVYDDELTASEVAAHYAVGTRG